MARVVDGLGWGCLLVLAACGTDTFVAPTDAAADSIVVDAAGDSGIDAPDAPSTFCTGKAATKCIDFDGPSTTFADYLGDISNGTGSAAGFDIQDFQSAPRGMRATMGANTTGTQFAQQAGGIVVLPSGGKRGLKADFMMRINPFTLGLVGEQVAVLTFKINAQDAIAIMDVKSASSDAWSLNVGKSNTAIPLTPPPPLGKWAHYVITLLFDTVAGSARLEVDQTVLGEKTGIQTTGETTSNSLSAFFGTTSIVGMTPSVITRVDDILLTVQ